MIEDQMISNVKKNGRRKEFKVTMEDHVVSKRAE